MAFRQRPYQVGNGNQQTRVPVIQTFIGQPQPSVPTFKQPRPYYRRVQVAQSVSQPVALVREDQQTPQFILAHYARKLTQLEQEEILGYSKIYYYGQNAQKAYNMQRRNFGYDDASGDALPALRDHVGYRYELNQLIGQGSFGKVFRAFDHMERRFVALKLLRNRQEFRKQGQIELRILRTLSAGGATSHCLPLLDSGDFRHHIYFSTELMPQDLYALLCKNGLRGLPLQRMRKYARHALTALAFAAASRIIHADIKPENMLVAQNDSIWIIDWGSGAFIGETIYSYIQSRYYRAPEVILGLPYSTPIDIWSLGCVLCEICTGQPVFPGENEQDQLGRICEVFGMPPLEMIRESPRKHEFFWDAGEGRTMLRTGHKVGRKKIENIIGAFGRKFVAFIRRMLVWDQNKRATAAELLNDPFFQEDDIEQDILRQDK